MHESSEELTKTEKEAANKNNTKNSQIPVLSPSKVCFCPSKLYLGSDFLMNFVQFRNLRWRPNLQMFQIHRRERPNLWVKDRQIYRFRFQLLLRSRDTTKVPKSCRSKLDSNFLKRKLNSKGALLNLNLVSFTKLSSSSICKVKVPKMFKVVKYEMKCIRKGGLRGD